MKTITSKFKIALVAVGLLTIGSISAQTKDAASANVIKDTPADGAVVRVIDNKGTIKYLQTNNGITSITSTTTGSATTTTWQLGGTLTDSTYIDVSNKLFALDGIELVTGAASTNAINKDTAKPGTTTATGYTLLVRDEATGATKKLLATDLITSGQTYFTVENDGDDEFDVSLSGTGAGNSVMAGSQIPLPEFSKVWVYRNGAKLIAGLDYTIAASTVTLVPNGTAPNDWTIYAGDVIEIQYFK